MVFSKIYLKVLALTTSIIAIYTGVIVLFVSPQIKERVIHLEEQTGKAHLHKIVTVVSSTARELISYEKNAVAMHKEELKNLTDVPVRLAREFYDSSQPEAVKEHLLSEIQSFRENLNNYYQQNQLKYPSRELEEIIKGFIRFYRYGGEEGYYFINKKTSSVLHPITPGLEGRNLRDLKDADGKYFVREFGKIAENRNGGFCSYKWLNPASQEIEEKLTYVFHFPPFDWIIGTGHYLPEIERQKQKEAIESVAKLRYGDHGYFFISDYDSVLISHPSLQGRDMSEVTDTEGRLVVPPMVKVARDQGEGFHRYSWTKLKDRSKPFEKLTYSKHFKEWKWVIGTGAYLDRVEREVKRKKVELVKYLRTLLATTKIADTGYFYIFDSPGNMIIHPNSNIEGTNFSQLQNPGKNSFIHSDVIDAYKSGAKVLYYTWDKPSDKGNYIYDKVSWIDYNKDFDWYICSSAYIAEINSISNKVKHNIWLISLLLLLVALSTSIYFFKKLLTPIESLSRTAWQVKSGDLSVRSNIQADDEIGTLAQTFDGMLDTIEDNITTLDKKVSERTKDLQEMIEKLEFLASHDPMTGIYNRRKFFELANREFNDGYDNLFAAMMDIDKFKKINDTYGHPVGDKVIKAVTAVISENITEDSIFGRLGGEEFAIVCRYDGEEDVLNRLELIRKKIEQLEIVTENGDVIRCTISEGVVKADASLKNLDALLQRADELLYEAKGSGRNRTIFRI